MRFIFLKFGKAKEVFAALAKAAAADKLLERKFGKRLTAGTPKIN